MNVIILINTRHFYNIWQKNCYLYKMKVGYVKAIPRVLMQSKAFRYRKFVRSTLQWSHNGDLCIYFSEKGLKAWHRCISTINKYFPLQRDDRHHENAFLHLRRYCLVPSLAFIPHWPPMQLGVCPAMSRINWIILVFCCAALSRRRFLEEHRRLG